MYKTISISKDWNFRNKLELMKHLYEHAHDEFYLNIEKDSSNIVPWNGEGILKSLGKRLVVFDDAGGILGEFRMFAPINGGTVLYLGDCWY